MTFADAPPIQASETNKISASISHQLEFNCLVLGPS
jgi:hypothetical protein